MTTTICLINNYNYSSYLQECLESVFYQSEPFDKVIVVDDGSTDSSHDVIRKYQKKYLNLYSVLKENQGQLSTFNAALELISDNSQVFLLDSDDIFPRDYLYLIKQKFNYHFPDFTYTRALKFADEDVTKIITSLASDEPNETFHKTSALTRNHRCWLGNPTSCISISSSLFKKIFPYPFPGDFITRADDVIVYASSIIGAEKVSIPSLMIGYRTHQNNNFLGAKLSRENLKKHDLAVDKLFSYYCSKFSIPENPSIKEFFEEIRLLNARQVEELNLPGTYKLLRRLIKKKYFRQ